MKFCDLRCFYAEPARGEMDGAGSCMTFTAIYCAFFDRHVMKSQVCDHRRKRSGTETPASADDGR